ncbi:6-chlorohydroxyquinol-1,2-dioxygenase [Streptomyces sulfonofaciens]|uniref:6-chlorohydroxyquinol-1,2-dioxygenase n=1 Tax=Streptomyces sulfonofaciens TaxID=68272 RepID=A0A919GF94_9ACTN|nr:6-chlorohydroxyquinol-1,2-dioxygenase [Streptomyces sulfonofaciens]
MLGAVSGTPDPRTRQIVEALIRHAHDFAREVGLQPEELLYAAEFLKRCGDVSDASRHEFILLSDVLGVTMVVNTLAADAPDGALEPSVLGPFYRSGAPLLPNGADLSRGGAADGEPAHVTGLVLAADGSPIEGAELDVWGTNADGLYENVDPSQPDYNLRGRFHTDARGRFEFWTVKPVSYPIPVDGPVGDLLAATNRSNMRPGHLHVIASAPGYQTIITELYTDDDQYIESDAVFGVKGSLVVHYDWIDDEHKVAASPRKRPYWELRRDLVLTPGTRTAVRFTAGREELAR